MTMQQLPGRRARLAVVAAAIAGALAGCGGSGDQPAAGQPSALAAADRGVLATIDDLQAAARKGDGRRICEQLFTDGLARSVAEAAGRSCRAEVRHSLFSPDAEFAVSSDISISGAQGRATIRERNGNESELVLLEDGGRWRIASVQPRA